MYGFVVSIDSGGVGFHPQENEVIVPDLRKTYVMEEASDHVVPVMGGGV